MRGCALTPHASIQPLPGTGSVAASDISCASTGTKLATFHDRPTGVTEEGMAEQLPLWLTQYAGEPTMPYT